MFSFRSTLLFFSACICWLLLLPARMEAGALGPVPEHAQGGYPYALVGVVRDSDGFEGSGALLASRVVATSARQFSARLRAGNEVSGLRWIMRGAAGDEAYSVKSVVFAPGFVEAVAAGDVMEVLEHDLMLLILDRDVPVPYHLPWNVDRLREDAFRQVVSVASGYFRPSDRRLGRLLATRSGEAVYSRFERLDGRLYASSDLKAGAGSSGSPVLSHYAGLWSVDAWVVDADPDRGRLMVMAVDADLSEWMQKVIDDEGAQRLSPSVSSLSQDGNASPKGSAVLTFGGATAFSIAPGNDVDHHLLNVLEPGTYRVESFGDLDVSGALLNRQSQLVASDDDSGDQYNFRMELLLDPGNYYLKVSPYSTRSGGDYELRVLQVDSTVRYDDDGTGPNTLKSLDANAAPGRYRLVSEGEVDRFLLRVDQPGHVVVWADGVLDLEGTLLPLGNSGEVMDRSDDAAGLGFNPLLDAWLAPGEYEVAVRSRNPREWGSYRLGARFHPADAAVGMQVMPSGLLGSATLLRLPDNFEQELTADRPFAAVLIESGAELPDVLQLESDGAGVSWLLYGEDFEVKAAAQGVSNAHSVRIPSASSHHYLMIWADGPARISLR
jgi:hypothetical protein